MRRALIVTVALALLLALHDASALGQTASASDTYLQLGFGAGFQFSPSLVLRPALSILAGADLVDDTVFGLSVTWALPR